LGKFFEIRLMTETEDSLTTAWFVLSKRSERDLSLPEKLHQRPSDFLSTSVVGSCATYIEKDFVVFHIIIWQVQGCRPLSPLGWRLKPGVVIPIYRPENRGEPF